VFGTVTDVLPVMVTTQLFPFLVTVAAPEVPISTVQPSDDEERIVTALAGERLGRVSSRTNADDAAVTATITLRVLNFGMTFENLEKKTPKKLNASERHV
jgi:hypothetical protein